MIVRIVVIAAGIILLAVSEKVAPVLDALTAPVLNAGRERARRTAASEIKTDPEEEDILDNKTKWRILCIGYALFLAVAIFSIISIFTLNNKINTLYSSIQDMEYKINTMETGAGDK